VITRRFPARPDANVRNAYPLAGPLFPPKAWARLITFARRASASASNPDEGAGSVDDETECAGGSDAGKLSSIASSITVSGGMAGFGLDFAGIRHSSPESIGSQRTIGMAGRARRAFALENASTPVREFALPS
jgi:hypothetical protein